MDEEGKDGADGMDAGGMERTGALDGRRGPVAAAFDGQRLDKALASLVPELSLRGRRRLFSAYEVLVDGVPRPMAHKVRQGAGLALRARPAAGEAAPAGEPAVVSLAGSYPVFFKPAGLHTESLGPGGGASLAAWVAARHPECLLLTRLDHPTSGLVLAARNDRAAREFRRLEDLGQVFKAYLCLARGRLERTVIANALDTDDRARTRVLDVEAADPLRITSVLPLAYDPALDVALAWACIKKGARHQIRAHLSHSGRALVGDALYGPGGEPPGTGLYLAHVLLRFPGFAAMRVPDWSLPSAMLEAALGRAIDDPPNMARAF